MVDLKQCIHEAGGYSRVAERLGTTKQVVWSWVNVLKNIPPKWVNSFSDVVGLPRYQIRPDIYPQSREASS